MNDENTRSNEASGWGIASAKPSSSRASSPARSSLRRARASASGSGSSPLTATPGRLRASSTTRLPVPHPTSSTRIPGRGSAAATIAARTRCPPSSHWTGS